MPTVTVDSVSSKETWLPRSNTLCECFNNMDVGVLLWLTEPRDKSSCHKSLHSLIPLLRFRIYLLSVFTAKPAQGYPQQQGLQVEFDCSRTRWYKEHKDLERCSSPKILIIYGAQSTRAPYGVAPEPQVEAQNQAKGHFSLFSSLFLKKIKK